MALCLMLAFCLTVSGADPVQVSYVAQIATISGTPFGLSSATHLRAVVSGYFQFDAETVDTLPADLQRGKYLHTAGLPGGFLFTFPAGHITGSLTPTCEVEDFGSSDTFRFTDGPRSSSIFTQGGVMQLNGVDNADIQLVIAISGNYIVGDSIIQLKPFPSAGDLTVYSHTFSVKDVSIAGNNVLLMQFVSLPVLLSNYGKTTGLPTNGGYLAGADNNCSGIDLATMLMHYRQP